MQRGTVVLLLFVIGVGVIIGLNLALRSQPPVPLTVAVDPLIADWARAQADAFNNASSQGGQRVVVTITPQNDVPVWRNRIWSESNRPDGWIPASTMAVSYAQAVGVPLEVISPSLAQTPLIFGGYESRVAVVLADALDADALGWAQIGEAARLESWQVIGGDAGWRFFKLAFPLPTQTSAGLGVLFSAAADYHGRATLDSADLSDPAFRDAFLSAIINSVPDYNAVGTDAPLFMVRSGQAVADIGIAPESQWLLRLGNFPAGDPIRLSYPRYLFVLDFPLVRWSGTANDPDTRNALERFAAFLGEPERQADLLNFGLRPTESTPAQIASAPLFGDPRALPDLSGRERVSPPARNTDAQGLLTWFDNARR